MARDTTPKFVPQLASRTIGEHPPTEWWYVRMRVANGDWTILSDDYITKRGAAREMRRIREEMGRLWMERLDAEAAAQN